MKVQLFKITFFTLLAALLATFGTNAADEKAYTPKDVEEAVKHLIATLEPDFLDKARRTSEEEFAGLQQMELGLWMRNNWGLWEGSHLRDYFNKLGIHHPDDMSSILLCSLWRKLNNIPIKLQDQIQCWKDWWQEREKLEQQSGDEKLKLLPNWICPNREIIAVSLPDKTTEDHEGRSNNSLKQTDQ